MNPYISFTILVDGLDYSIHGSDFLSVDCPPRIPSIFFVVEYYVGKATEG